MVGGIKLSVVNKFKFQLSIKIIHYKAIVTEIVTGTNSIT